MFLSFLLLFTFASAGQINTLEVRPDATETGIYQITSPHLVLWDETQAPRRSDLLLVAIGGTNSKTSELLAFQQMAVGEGMHSVGIDYPNMVISTTCQNHPPLDCYEQYRAEITTGQQISDIVNVNEKNSIEHRLEKLLVYMVKKNPTRWGRFYVNDKINWDRIVLVGHSQGSGHIAFMAKKHKVHALIMSAGPQDSSVYGEAPWLSWKGETAPENHYFFLHKEDFFGSSYQVNSARVLLDDQNAEVDMIKTTIPETSSAHIFMTDVPNQDPHNSLTKPAFINVWRSLLQRAAQ